MHLRRPEPRERLIVIVGDHQPMANVSGSASWDVPVHVIARDPELLAPFVARGFVSGMEPPRRSLGAMHELTSLLLDAFAGTSVPMTNLLSAAPAHHLGAPPSVQTHRGRNP